MKENLNNTEIKQSFSASDEGNLKIQFVCDECCLPLSLYGENVILSVYNDEFITHLFCDLHADEFLSGN